MEAIPAPASIYGTGPVHERRGGSRQDADAFRRAMQENGQPGSEPPDPTDVEHPVRRSLQRRAPIVRREDGEARHIDVVA